MKYLILLSFLTLLISGCDTNNGLPGNIEPNEDGIIGGSIGDVKYTGEVLAGTNTKYIDFNKEDYQNALASGKTVVLVFYSNLNQISTTEEPETLQAFNELNFKDVVGFRVDFEDPKAEAFENNLAYEFNVKDFNTKVIVKYDTVLTKSTQGWDKSRYIEQITNYAS